MTIEQFLDLSLGQQARRTAIAALCVGGAFLAGNWYTVSSVGFGGIFVSIILVLALLPFFLALLGLLFSPLGLLAARTRRKAIAIFACSSIFLAINIEHFLPLEVSKLITEEYDHASARFAEVHRLARKYINQDDEPFLNQVIARSELGKIISDRLKEDIEGHGPDVPPAGARLSGIPVPRELAGDIQSGFGEHFEFVDSYKDKHDESSLGIYRWKKFVTIT